MTNEDLKKRISESEEKDFKEYAIEQLRYAHILQDMGYTAGEAISFMIFLELKGISDVLYGEGIFGSVAESLSALSDCVDHIPPNPYCPEGRSIFRIGGHVDTENY